MALLPLAIGSHQTVQSVPARFLTPESSLAGTIHMKREVGNSQVGHKPISGPE